MKKKKNTVSKGMYCVIPLHNTPEIKKVIEVRKRLVFAKSYGWTGKGGDRLSKGNRRDSVVAIFPSWLWCWSHDSTRGIQLHRTELNIHTHTHM